MQRKTHTHTHTQLQQSDLVWRCLVLDEGHKIKNETSGVAEACSRVRSRTRLLLTGTPLQNNLHELWAVLTFLYPRYFDRKERGGSSAFDGAFDLSGRGGGTAGSSSSSSSSSGRKRGRKKGKGRGRGRKRGSDADSSGSSGSGVSVDKERLGQAHAMLYGCFMLRRLKETVEQVRKRIDVQM